MIKNTLDQPSESEEENSTKGFIDFINNELKSFNENKTLSREMLFHHSIKLYHGYRSYLPDVWFKSLFLEELVNMIPFVAGGDNSH